MPNAFRPFLVVSACLLTALVCGCSTISRQGIQSIAIAPDDQTFVFSYQSESRSLLAIGTTRPVDARVVLEAEGGAVYERPIFSRDGKRIFFILRAEPDKSDLYAVGTDGFGLMQITRGQDGTQNIQDLALSADGGNHLCHQLRVPRPLFPHRGIASARHGLLFRTRRWRGIGKVKLQQQLFPKRHRDIPVRRATVLAGSHTELAQAP